MAAGEPANGSFSEAEGPVLKQDSWFWTLGAVIVSIIVAFLTTYVPMDSDTGSYLLGETNVTGCLNFAMEVRIHDDGLREAHASKDIAKGEPILRMPLTTLFGVENVSDSMLTAIKHVTENGEIRTKVGGLEVIAIGILEQIRNPTSQLMEAYINDLPETQAYPYFSDDVMEVFRNVGHLKSLKMEEATARFQTLIRAILALNSTILYPPPTTHEQLWAYMAVSSRYFDLSPTEAASNSEERSFLSDHASYLIPVLDLVNHHWDSSKANVKKHIEGNVCELRASRDIVSGEPLRMSYGNWSNLELLAVYGFAIKGNPNGGKVFGIQSRSMRNIRCSLQLSSLNAWGYVSISSIMCIRQLAYTSDGHSKASAAGYLTTLPYLNRKVPDRVHTEMGRWLSYDLSGYSYIKDLCISMESDLKSSSSLSSILRIASRSDPLSQATTAGWNDHLKLAEGCANWWREKVREIRSKLADLVVLEDSRLYPYRISKNKRPSRPPQLSRGEGNSRVKQSREKTKGLASRKRRERNDPSSDHRVRKIQPVVSPRVTSSQQIANDNTDDDLRVEADSGRVRESAPTAKEESRSDSHPRNIAFGSKNNKASGGRIRRIRME